jgi:tetratricopeptide (TPR) repeat protein
VHRHLVAALCLVLAPFGACTTGPLVEGIRADQLSSAQILEAAERAHAAERHLETAEYAEYVLRNDFDFGPRGRVRFLAAEGRFGNRDFEDAIVHYRRLLDDDPLTPRAQEVAGRLWSIGRELVRAPAESDWFTDRSSRFDAGVEALQMLVTYFPGHELADDAWRELGLAFRDDGLHQAAADCFEHLARNFQDSEWSDFALYHVVAEYRALSRGGAYDVGPLLVAHAALGRYLEAYPEGNFAALARDERRAIEAEVVRRELAIAAFYRFRGNTAGEALHLANAATRFPAADGAAEAAALLVERGYEPAAGAPELLRPRQDRPRFAAGRDRDVLDVEKELDSADR